MVDGVLIMNIELVKKQFVLFYPVAMEWIADNIKHIESYYITFPHETEDTIHGNNCKFSIDICVYNGDRLTLDCSCMCSSEYEFGALYTEPTLKHFDSLSGAGRLTDPYIKIGNDNVSGYIKGLNDRLAKIVG